MARILVVDDERSIRNTLKDILEVESYRVEVVESGIEALKLIKESNYDLIFSDIKMPQMDGVELLQNIKQCNPEIPIVILP